MQTLCRSDLLEGGPSENQVLSTSLAKVHDCFDVVSRSRNIDDDTFTEHCVFDIVADSQAEFVSL
jgi:hypothetical protein